MSSYHEIAEHVFRRVRRPMTSREILREAHSIGIVPVHLFGSTQHKTLQARLSEEILRRRERSVFIRTKPGVFFLRSFLRDTSIPLEYRVEMRARRRTRDLLRGSALAVKTDHFKRLFSHENSLVEWEDFNRLITSDVFGYVNPKNVPDDHSLVWISAAVRKDGRYLVYWSGSYRDERSDFTSCRSLLFSSLIDERSCNLFDEAVWPVDTTLQDTLAIDLNFDILNHEYFEGFKIGSKEVALTKVGGRNVYILFVRVEAPKWFEPEPKRLSITGMKWTRVRGMNSYDDLDPWSRLAVQNGFTYQ